MREGDRIAKQRIQLSASHGTTVAAGLGSGSPVMSSFVPRSAFSALDSLPRTYYLGHHASGLAKIRRTLSSIDIVIECRDSRIPLTSRNPLFEEALSEKERIIVYTKKDLAGPRSLKNDPRVNYTLRTFEPVRAMLMRRGRSIFSANVILLLLCIFRTITRAATSTPSSSS